MHHFGGLRMISTLLKTTSYNTFFTQHYELRVVGKPSLLSRVSMPYVVHTLKELLLWNPITQFPTSPKLTDRNPFAPRKLTSLLGEKTFSDMVETTSSTLWTDSVFTHDLFPLFEPFIGGSFWNNIFSFTNLWIYTNKTDDGQNTCGGSGDHKMTIVYPIWTNDREWLASAPNSQHTL